MSCTRRFLNVQWEHHSWRPRVICTADVATRETDMWGRQFNTHYVHCEKHDVCEVCGKTRRNRHCMCDTAQAEHCRIRLAWIDERRQSTQ